jgi:hypothetical protein
MWHLHVLLFFYILFHSILFVLLHDVKEGKTAKLSVGGWRSGPAGLEVGGKGKSSRQLAGGSGQLWEVGTRNFALGTSRGKGEWGKRRGGRKLNTQAVAGFRNEDLEILYRIHQFFNLIKLIPSYISLYMNQGKSLGSAGSGHV